MKIEVFKGRSKKYYWRLVAENGKTIAASETYSSKAKALQTISSLKSFFIQDQVPVFVNGKIVPVIPVKA